VKFLAPIVATDATIFAIVGLLIVWAGLSAIRLYWRTESLISNLRRGRALVETATDPRAFAASFEAAARQLAELGPLATAWSAFRDTLIVPAVETPFHPVRSTVRPDLVFDLGLLRAAGLRPRYHAGMPGMLVGAGLLFTFLGLSVALAVASGIVAGGTPAQSRDGLHQLLDAASFKFVTSLAGLALSIAYTGFRNFRIRSVEQALDGFTAALDRQMPLATPAFLQHEANEELRNQSAVLQTFSTDLAVSIGEKLDSAFDQRLGEHIGPLTEAIQALASRTTADNQDAVRQMMQAIIDQLSGGTRDHLAGVAENLAVLGTRLEALQTGLGEASVRMAQSAEAMAARMGEGAEAALSRITDQMGGLMETLRSVTAQTREAGAEAAQTLATRIAGAAAGFEASATRMTETLAQAATGTSEALARAGEAADGLGAAAAGVRETLENTGQALARQSNALAATAEALAARIGELDRATREAVAPFAAGAADLRRTAEAAQAATAPLRAVANSLGTAVEQMGGAAERFEAAQAGAAKLSEGLAAAAQRFEGVDRSLADTLSALSAALDEFRRKIQEFVDRTDGNLAKAADQVSTMIRELDETLEDFGLDRRIVPRPQPHA
jgi:ABC-type transporter Mla subunit MlaD